MRTFLFFFIAITACSDVIAIAFYTAGTPISLWPLWFLFVLLGLKLPFFWLR